MHFEDKIWADYIRGTAAPASSEQVKSHLQTGCQECSQTLKTWQQLADATRRDRSYTPPTDVVRMVKQEFAIQHGEKEAAQPLMATLVFDSLKQPSPVGIRSAGTSARQVLYEAEGITIDLRFAANPPSKHMVVVGQVMEKSGLRGAIPILVFNERGNAVVETQTTEFGEFEIEFDATQPLRLSFEFDRGRKVQVPLHDAGLELTE